MSLVGGTTAEHNGWVMGGGEGRRVCHPQQVVDSGYSDTDKGNKMEALQPTKLGGKGDKGKVWVGEQHPHTSVRYGTQTQDSWGAASQHTHDVEPGGPARQSSGGAGCGEGGERGCGERGGVGSEGGRWWCPPGQAPAPTCHAPTPPHPPSPPTLRGTPQALGVTPNALVPIGGGAPGCVGQGAGP